MGRWRRRRASHYRSDPNTHHELYTSTAKTVLVLLRLSIISILALVIAYHVLISRDI